MRPRPLPAFVLIVALAALAVTVGYAVAHATGEGGGFGGMNRSSFSMMGSGGKATNWYNDGTGPVGDIAAARAQARRFADRLGLETGEVMQFRNSYYVRLDDRTGHGATEVLVDPQTGAVTLEYGPAMMWNARYGMMTGASRGSMMGGGSPGMMGGGSQGGMMGGGAGGMMGGSVTNGSGMMGSYGSSPSWTPLRGSVTGTVSAVQARRIANDWLAVQGKGLRAGEPDAMPGYFTMDTSKNGKIDGMLSVNARTGAVWYHWWHGKFVAMEA